MGPSRFRKGNLKVNITLSNIRKGLVTVTFTLLYPVVLEVCVCVCVCFSVCV